MIRRLIGRVFGKKSAGGESLLRVLEAGQHPLQADQISGCARRVVTTLQEGGYQAYIVGGAVRDLMLGKTPKDFDVGTNATPEQIRRLIRRARLIGRRFQIIQVPCRDEIVEVTTFRGPSREDPQHQTDEHGRLTRDNVFGTLEQDAARRDFTVNALYYDPVRNQVLDYFSGTADVGRRTLRMIGDPASRYREDPVRLLRAVRFAAKLEFSIEESTRAPILPLADLLKNVPESRLFDEMLKLLLSGHARACLGRLREEGLHHDLLPLLDMILDQPEGNRFIERSLASTDERVRDGRPISPGFLFAALLWPALQQAWKKHEDAGLKTHPALQAAMDEVLSSHRQNLAIPRRYDAIMKEVWGLQPRFTQRAGLRPFRFLEHPRFRAAYDFMRLRAEGGELPEAVAQWWDDFQNADDDGREAMLVAEERPKGGRRRRR